jgi:hypothetical protein
MKMVLNWNFKTLSELKERVGARYAILNDLSPAACHIAYNYTTPVDVEALRREFERIKAAVKDEFDWLYGTEHYEPAVGLYDPQNPDVTARIENPPAGVPPSNRMFGEGLERTWQLIDLAEVERRLGYLATDLPRDKDWGDLDVAKVDQWVCIPATIQYTVWSDVLRCEGLISVEEPTGRLSTRGKNVGKPILRKKRVPRGCCGNIVLWDVAVDKKTGEVLESFACPHCGQVWRKKDLTPTGSVPVLTDYEYDGLSPRRRGKLVQTQAARRRTARVTTARERQHLAKIESSSIPYWYPRDTVDPGREMMRHGLLKRGIRTIQDFYTKRNLWAMAHLWSEAELAGPGRVNDLLRFALTSIIPYVSLKQS